MICEPSNPPQKTAAALKHPAIFRRGFSLIELTVCTAVIAVLIGITVPAVQQARESARRMCCQNNLRQCGLALTGCAAQHGVFPTGLLTTRTSPLMGLLPYIEQSALYDQIVNHRVERLTNVTTFCCPSDPEIFRKNENLRGDSSYLMNRGTQFPGAQSVDRFNGFVKNLNEPTSPVDVTDGLSNTVAMSERLVMPNEFLTETAPDRIGGLRSLWWTEQRFSKPGTEDSAVEQALNHRVTQVPMYFFGMVNRYRSMKHYDHLLTPNLPGSHNGPDDYESGLHDEIEIIPATSLHPGGVHCLLADGSVRFHADSIDRFVWKALGTRNGAEAGITAP